MERICLICLVVLSSIVVHAQTVTNVVAKQVGNTVEITYDIDKPAKVSLLLSKDGGATYAPIPKTLSGDVGLIKAGHRKITWNMLADGEDWEVQNARFKVVAKNISKHAFTVNGISFTMIYVDGGTFTMGCTEDQGRDCEFDEKPAHQVTLSDYYIGEIEVTCDLWDAVMLGKKSKEDKDPKTSVTWFDCQAFIRKLNTALEAKLGALRFALPTEAEWEYAAREGHMAGSYQYKFSGSDAASPVAVHSQLYGVVKSTASKQANALGIYDMSGNVWEWCHDWYGAYSEDAEINPTGTYMGTGRVKRGGGASSKPVECRVANRSYDDPNKRSPDVGFRLVLR